MAALAGALGVGTGDLPTGLLFASYSFGLFAASLLATQRLRESVEQGRDIERELDFREVRRSIGHEAPEARAQKLFQLHSVELKRYYDQTLRQGSFIFWVGVACIALGFGIIIAGFIYLAMNDATQVPQKIVIAIVTGIGGILANFIAVIYLRMFSTTVSSVAAFHQRLVGTHHLHFGNFLISKIGDRSAELRYKALSDMAVALANATAMQDVVGLDRAAEDTAKKEDGAVKKGETETSIK
jgi:TRADD-N domain-containing protein